MLINSIQPDFMQVLEKFGIPCEVSVVSAHRTPERMMEYAKTAHKRGIKVIIAGAGGACESRNSRCVTLKNLRMFPCT
jgi:phosphoribosylaminoimidazole carboxylase PurE protein